MILYHGSNIEVSNPSLKFSNKARDFGNGFYLTTDKEQARNWAEKKTLKIGNGKPIVSIFEIDENVLKNMNVKIFESPSSEWFDYVVAQMLVARGRKLYFFSRNNHDNSDDTMEIDFIISKNKITSKHNIVPIEVKSGSRYTFSSLTKFKNKYHDYLDKPIIIHTKDLLDDSDYLYLPVYMTCLL